MRVSRQISRLRAVWRRANASRYARPVRRVFRWLVFAGLVGYLGYQLTAIGWHNVWASLPRTPWFYLLSLVMYAMLPLVESFIYRRLWNTPFWASLPVFFRKRVFNHDVVGYSGELYLAWWGRKHVAGSRQRVLGTVKDNTIVSGLTSTIVAVSVLAVFFLFDQIALLEPYLPDSTMIWIGIGGLALVAIGLGVALRRTIFSLDGNTLAFLAGVHTARYAAINVLQIVQWMVVLPDVPMASWISLIALFIVINQLPFLPGRDLVFMGAGVELSTLLGISPAALAGMLLVKSVIDKSLNMMVFLGTGMRGATALSETAGESGPAAETARGSDDTTIETVEGFHPDGEVVR